MAIPRPFNLQKWIDENRHELKPPVGNRNLYKEAGDYIVMIVAGPNARKDYHYNETEELYYQLEGNIIVRIQEDGKPVDIPINEGEMFLLPAKVPHSPIRSEGSIGLVTVATIAYMRHILSLRTSKKISSRDSKNIMDPKNSERALIVAHKWL